MDELERQLKKMFANQAVQLISDNEKTLLELERSTDQVALMENILRNFHNLKGSANGVGFDDFGEICHLIESILIKSKKNEPTLSESLVSLLLKSNDTLGAFAKKLNHDITTSFNFSALKLEIEGTESAIATVATVPTMPQNQEPVIKMPVKTKIISTMTPMTAANPVETALPRRTSPRLININHSESNESSSKPLEVYQDGSRVITFGLGAHEFAIPLTLVKEVRRHERVKPSPEAPDYVLGLSHLRGKIIQIVDLALLLHLESISALENAVIVVEHQTNGGHQVLGLRVNQLNSVIELNPAMIAPHPQVIPTPDAASIAGVYKNGDGFIFLLNFESVIGRSDRSHSTFMDSTEIDDDLKAG